MLGFGGPVVGGRPAVEREIASSLTCRAVSRAVICGCVISVCKALRRGNLFFRSRFQAPGPSRTRPRQPGCLETQTVGEVGARKFSRLRCAVRMPRTYTLHVRIA